MLLTALLLAQPAFGHAQAGEELCRFGDAIIESTPAAVMAGKSGKVRCERVDTHRLLRDMEFEAGKLMRQREWNDLGQQLEVQFHDNGAVRTRMREVVYHGQPAWDREDFWESGLLRLRGTYLPTGQAQGLVQTFHESGPLASETWYEDGKLQRRKVFATDGRQTFDEEYTAEGKIKSTMRRF